MGTAARWTVAVAAVGCAVLVLQPSGLVLLGGFVVACLVLIARLTASPLMLGHAEHDTWFDDPSTELVVRGANRVGRVDAGCR